jgi:CO/xanthine dehydrogenase FAD-binding subunit
VLLAYDAQLHLASDHGSRRIPYQNFHLGYKLCDLAPDELITAIELPRKGPDTAYHARKVGPRQAQAISKACIAARARCAAGVIEELRLAFGSVAPIPLRCEKTERLLIGRPVNATLISEAQAALREEISPIDDMRSSSWYRAQVSANLLADFLRRLQ